MSWDEYNDLFDLAQEKGKYHLFVFDIKGSRNGYDNLIIQELRNCIFSRLKDLELQRGIDIIHTPVEEARGHRSGILGDVFSVIIIRDTLAVNEVHEIFKEEKKKLNIPYEFHYDDGFYETDDWVLGNTLYYREYAIPFLEKRSKDKKDTI